MSTENINDIIRETIPTYSESEILEVLNKIIGNDSILIKKILEELRDINFKKNLI